MDKIDLEDLYDELVVLSNKLSCSLYSLKLDMNEEKELIECEHKMLDVLDFLYDLKEK